MIGVYWAGCGYSAKQTQAHDRCFWLVVDEADCDVFAGRIVFLTKRAAVRAIRHMVEENPVKLAA